MASRDNQTMQIFVIVLALFSLLLGVGLFMVNNWRKTAVARAQAATTEADNSRDSLRGLQKDANSYKQWIGYAEADTYQTLQKNFDEDMARWGSTFEENNRSFRTILENIFEENRKLAQSESDAKALLKTKMQQLLATESQKNEQIAKFEDDTKKALADKESLRNEFAKSRAEVNQAKDNLAAQLAEQRTKIDTLTAKHSETQQTLQDKINKLNRVIEILKSNQAPTDPYAQPDCLGQSTRRQSLAQLRRSRPSSAPGHL
ncbi:MAG: hypothetical protein GXP24_09835 [Planctomycetes bacterium]|nr:hypothetical protein [Planctomycetota bacterium]